jgi:predicted double-glycine peptidase
MKHTGLILFTLLVLSIGFPISAWPSGEEVTLKPLRNWKSLRDDRVVKQQLDYSCGAAALATILREHFGKNVSEQDVLIKINQMYAASLADMQRILPEYGLKGVGLSLGFEQLQKLRAPAVVYLRHEGQDHFSVIRGISTDMVWLADPSWGNRKLSHHIFRGMFETEADKPGQGRILVIAPASKSEKITASDFFEPPKQSLDLIADSLSLHKLCSVRR